MRCWQHAFLANTVSIVFVWSSLETRYVRALKSKFCLICPAFVETPAFVEMWTAIGQAPQGDEALPIHYTKVVDFLVEEGLLQAGSIATSLDRLHREVRRICTPEDGEGCVPRRASFPAAEKNACGFPPCQDSPTTLLSGR